MISIVEEMYCFDELEYIIEEMTVAGVSKYGDEFIDKLSKFLKSELEETSIVESYYTTISNDPIFEIGGVNAALLAASAKPTYNFVKDMVKSSNSADEMEKSVKGEHDSRRKFKKITDYNLNTAKETGTDIKNKKGIISQAISKIGKTKVGRAITRGVKRAVYGSEIGRKLLKTKADLQRKYGTFRENLAKTDLATSSNFAAGAAVGPKNLRRGNMMWSNYMARQAAKKQASAGKNYKAADKQERKLHLLSKLNPRTMEKANIKVKSKTDLKSTFKPALA